MLRYETQALPLSRVALTALPVLLHDAALQLSSTTPDRTAHPCCSQQPATNPAQIQQSWLQEGRKFSDSFFKRKASTLLFDTFIATILLYSTFLAAFDTVCTLSLNTHTHTQTNISLKNSLFDWWHTVSWTIRVILYWLWTIFCNKLLQTYHKTPLFNNFLLVFLHIVPD